MTHLKTIKEIISDLEKRTDLKSLPIMDLILANFKSLRSDQSGKYDRNLESVRQYFENNLIEAPDGNLYKIWSLQRDYLRYVLVERFHEAGKTWDSAYEEAAEYLCVAKKVNATTVRDSHSKIKKLLKKDGMREFCHGLEYEFPVAMSRDGPPKPGTYVDPYFLRENDIAS